MHWQSWAPSAGNMPTSILNARPFRTILSRDDFPAVSDGSGGGARHSYYSEVVVKFLKRGVAYDDFFPWKDDVYFLPRGEVFCPGMPPKGKSQISEEEGAQNDEHTRAALNELHKAAPATAPSGLAVS
eukprot:1638177-Pyramimonas_sp.AAC.1